MILNHIYFVLITVLFSMIFDSCYNEPIPSDLQSEFSEDNEEEEDIEVP